MARKFKTRRSCKRKMRNKKSKEVNGYIVVSLGRFGIGLFGAMAGAIIVYLILSNLLDPTNQLQVEENTRNIQSLAKDVDRVEMDVAKLSAKFDEFMFKTIGLMMDMREVLGGISKDESIHLTLANIGNPTTDSGSTAASETTTSQELTSSCGYEESKGGKC